MSWVATAVVGAAVIGGGVSYAINSSNANDARDANQAALDQQMLAQQQANSAQADYGQASIDAQLAAAGMSADAIKYAADKSAEIQWKMYSQARDDQMPWLVAGRGALGTLQEKMAAGPGEFKEDPGYQFRLSQGNDNILSNAAATGSLASGRTLKALTEYGQDYASNEYDKFINRYYQSLTPYQSLAGLGQTTATNLGQQGISTGNAVASNITSAGNNLANLYQGTASQLGQIYTNTGNNLASSYMNQGKLLSQYGTNMANIGIANNTNTGNAIIGGLNNAMMGLSSYYGNVYGGQTSQPSSYNIAPSAYQTSYGAYSLG